MRRHLPVGLLLLPAFALTAPPSADAQGAASIVFVSRRPPRSIPGNIRSWAGANRVNAVAEDAENHVWRVQFMAFLSRPPNASGVNVIFYHVQNGRRRYVFSEQVALSDPASRIFFHQSLLHRSPDEFQPMEHYEVAVSVADARGQHEIARGRIGLTGVVERHSGVVDFTGAAPVVR
ncbi:MAG: hypothetical protein R3A48_01710 [Polyangiales bacterium]